MANQDIVNVRGATSEYKDDRGGGNTIPSAVMGIVKNNVDPTRSGRIEVFLKRATSGANPDKPGGWTTVKYLSPFFGYTPNTGNPDGHGDYVGNPNSYGFWATPPDIGTEIVCLFLNGDPSDGYYVGCVPRAGQTQMVPGIGAADNIIANGGEAKSYGGATRLPVGESNNANPKQANALNQSVQPRPVHSYQAAVYNKQGLLRDPDRGPISSSSMRESPSRVFGISTPGRPIYQGGYTDETIPKAAADPNVSNQSFQVVGRTGGHTLVMDDGDIAGKDQLLRLRTSSGHTILMNDTAQTLFIIHANGQSYIELGKEGTIDMYSTNSVNIRTQGDLNLHADRNININAGKELNINAENVQVESEKATNLFAGTNFAQSVKGSYTAKVDSGMSLASEGEASFVSSAVTYINGSKINLNSGSSGLAPQAVKQVAKIKHTDTLYDSEKGFLAAPGKLSSITSRAPAHTPWASANKGVDAQVSLDANKNYPEATSAPVAAINSSAPAAPTNPTTPSVLSTVPNSKATIANTDKLTSNALTSQMAVNAATGPAAVAVASTAGTVSANGVTTAVLGTTGLTPTQLATAGYIKPGMEVAIDAAISAGKSLEEAIPTTAWTGKDGINSIDDYLKNQSTQVNATQTLLDKSKTALVEKGVISAKESSTATGGLVLATASAGIGPVTDYLKKVSAASIPSLSSLTSALPVGGLNALSGSIPNLIAGGKMAAGLADKAMSGLSLGDATASVSGASKGLFDKIAAGFKPLQAGQPISLSATNAANELEKAKDAAPPTVSSATASLAASASKATGSLGSLDVTGMMNKAMGSATSLLSSNPTVSSLTGAASGLTAMASKLGGTLSSTVPSGVDNLPGGLSSVSSVVKNDVPLTVPGLSGIKDSMAKVSGAASGALSSVTDVVSGIKDKLGADTNLASFASLGLSKDDLAKLSGSINSLSAGGAAEVKLPTIAEGTNDVAALAAQSKSLLGNPIIPSLKI